MQQTGSQVFRVTGPHNIGTGSLVSVVQPAGSLGTDFGSQVIGSPYRASRSQGSPVVGTPTSGSQVTRPSTSGRSSDEVRPMWEQPSGKKKPKWLRETLNEAQEFGAPREPARAIQMPDRLGMALVASLRDSIAFYFRGGLPTSCLARCHDG